jgi:hypothetical protein
VDAAQASNYHFRNNLILGWKPSEPVFSVDTFTSYTSSGYNGFRPAPEAERSFVWKSPSPEILKDYDKPGFEHKSVTLEEYSQATGQDEHGILVDYDIFSNASKVDPDDVTRIYKAEDIDFHLKPGAAAVDAGCILPNINDDVNGNAPDLGALEVGQTVPIYGPRP